MSNGLVVYGYIAWCLSTGLGFVTISPLSFEEDTGEYPIFLLFNEVHVHAKAERNQRNSFGVMKENVTLLVLGLWVRRVSALWPVTPTSPYTQCTN